jgi:hypothetical protein
MFNVGIEMKKFACFLTVLIPLYAPLRAEEKSQEAASVSLNAESKEENSCSTDIHLAESSFTFSVSEEKGKIIEEIVSTIGKTSVISLGFKQGHLKSLGKQLSGLGPLQFLAYIFLNEELTHYMKHIRKSSFKWNGFIDGLKGGLTKEADSNKLFSQLPGFSKLVQVQYETLEPSAKSRNWEEFVSVIIYTKTGK